MASRRRRYPPKRCGWCDDGQLTWDVTDELYVCGGCGQVYTETMARELPTDDGRIRGPEDVAPRIAGVLDVARGDKRLSPPTLAVFERLCEIGLGFDSIYVLGSSRYLSDELELQRNTVRRALARLEGFGYVRATSPQDVPLRRVRDIIKARRTAGLTPPTVYELRAAPDPLPICSVCYAPIDDARRVSAIYCSDRCRKRVHRMNEARSRGLEKARATLAAKRANASR